MERNSRLGDRMPDRRNVKWGDMKPSSPHMSEEWVDMYPSEEVFSGKWDEQHPSAARMSERYVDMEVGDSQFSDKWHEMQQEKRQDPYQLSPSSGDRKEPSMVKQSKNDMKNSGHGRYQISGSEGQSGKGL